MWFLDNYSEFFIMLHSIKYNNFWVFLSFCWLHLSLSISFTPLTNNFPCSNYVSTNFFGKFFKITTSILEADSFIFLLSSILIFWVFPPQKTYNGLEWWLRYFCITFDKNVSWGIKKPLHIKLGTHIRVHVKKSRFPHFSRLPSKISFVTRKICLKNIAVVIGNHK